MDTESPTAKLALRCLLRSPHILSFLAGPVSLTISPFPPLSALYITCWDLLKLYKKKKKKEKKGKKKEKKEKGSPQENTSLINK